jgi:hypothetical protein
MPRHHLRSPGRRQRRLGVPVRVRIPVRNPTFGTRFGEEVESGRGGGRLDRGCEVFQGLVGQVGVSVGMGL